MIAKVKSFSKAADKLFLTQPTISNHIHNLEKELGTALFNRTNKNITLTNAGEILFKYAVSILNKRDHAFFSLNAYKGRIEGILEIASSSIPEQYYLTELMCSFSQKYPDVKYNLMKYDTKKVIDKLNLGEIDFGIVGAKKDSPQLDYMDIMDDDIVLVAPTSGVFDSDTIDLEALKDTQIIMREEGSGTRAVVEAALKSRSISYGDLNVVAEIESTETIKKLVINGLGVSFISKKALEYELQNNQLQIIQVKNLDITRKFYFVYHTKRVLSPLSEAFKEYIITYSKLE
jgi:DNA-binding transcriptional LysR family regulator